MKVTCVFLQEFIKMAGAHKITVELGEGATVRDLVEKLDREVVPGIKEKVLEGDQVKWPAEIAVNGRRIEFLEGLDTKLREGDQVILSPRALFVL